MVPYRYAYLIGCAVFTLIWIYLYKKRKEYRPEMLLLSILGGTVGPIINYFFYRQDWWRPEYFTGIHGGIEDAIYGFTNLGIVAVLFEELFEKKYTRRITPTKLDYAKALPKFIVFMLVVLVPTWVLFYVFKLHSLWGSVVGFTLGGIFILYKRPDLLKDSLGSAILTPLMSLPGFFIPEMFSPGVIKTYWLMDNLSRVTLMTAPLEDVVWYAFIGFCFGSVFEYLFDFKIRK